MSRILLSIQNLTKRYNGTLALDQVSLDVTAGEIVCLLGPSGCGKTTLLRIVAGLEQANVGQVLYEGKDLASIPPHRRDFGMMFQDYALFPHKNVFENVAFGLKMQAKPQTEIRQRGQEMLALVGLAGFERRSVNDLSGGEAQRVALARSLAPRPRLLMLDEPLGALDRGLRERLMLELRNILKTVGVTVLYVTHDQAEAFAIADRVVVMNAGHIEQVGPPETIYRAPATLFVARFLGLSNLAEGQVVSPSRITSAWGALAVDPHPFKPGDPVTVLIRPEAARLEAQASPKDIAANNSTNILRGRLVTRSFRGRSYRVQIQPESGPPLSLELGGATVLPEEPDAKLAISLDPAGIVLLPEQKPS